MKKMMSKSRVVIAIIIAIMFILAMLAIILHLNAKTSNNSIVASENIDGGEVTTNPEEVGYQYKEGILCTVVDESGNPKQSDFVIEGIILAGNRHSYDVEGASESASEIEKLLIEGYKVEGVNSSFYLNEYIQFYIYTNYNGYEDDVKILATPHKTVEEYEKMSFEQLKELADSKGFVLDYKKPDIENNRYVGENYVNIDYPEGMYDILFTYKGKLAYYININETKEPNQ